MAYKPEIFEAVQQAYKKRQAKNEYELSARKRDAYSACPRLAEIDRLIIVEAAGITRDILANGNAKNKILQIQRRIGELNSEKYELLAQIGHGPDYLDMHYDCAMCHDTGYNGVKTCKCVDKELKKAAFEHSTLGSALREQTFESFSTMYYPENIKPGMEKAVTMCREFSENVGATRTDSLVFVGGTGLGKTHLASAIAHRTVERGHSVVYVTAPEMFMIFDDEKFGRVSRGSSSGVDILNCDLLIIDDLGSEYTTAMTISSLFTVINTRSVKELATIITTNLSMSELENTYNDKIVSRILGEFVIIPFAGNDIRLIKRKQKQ